MVTIRANEISNIISERIKLNTLPDHWKLLQRLSVMLENYGEMGCGFIYIKVN